jgi:hypothetical protein
VQTLGSSISIAEELLFSERFLWEGKSYVVDVYRHAAKQERCLHIAETVLGPGDTVISDGRSPEEALHRQKTILPLAILSRSLLELSHLNA